MDNNINHFEHSNSESDDEILDWNKEAEAIIRDIKDHVNEIFVSSTLQSNNYEIYINLKTLENNKFCVRASGAGFQIAGKNYDDLHHLDEPEVDIYETPYALLTEISEGYVQSFAQRLSEQIQRSLV